MKRQRPRRGWDDVVPWQAAVPPVVPRTIQWEKEKLPLDRVSFQAAPALNARIALEGPRADICSFAVDAIVNAANSQLQGGSGVDGAIHAMAGPGLRKELAGKWCPVGEVVVSEGHKTFAKKILHTVAPIGRGDAAMVSCYRNCLEQAVEHNLRTVAFCCLGTGVFSFPNARAAWLALHTVRSWLETSGKADRLDGIIFVTFQAVDHEAYLHLLPKFFPKEDDTTHEVVPSPAARRDPPAGAVGAGLPPPTPTPPRGIGWAAVTPWAAAVPPPPSQVLAWEAANPLPAPPDFAVAPALNRRIALVGPQADICHFAVDAIVNAANEALLDGAGVNGAIHMVAGPGLWQELAGKRCPVGEVVVSEGHCTLAKKILHTVAPIGPLDDAMVSCYRNCLEQAVEHDLRTIAFCCLGTGVFGFPNARAAWLALHTVRSWLETSGKADRLDGIIFVTFQAVDHKAYLHLLPKFFPREAPTQGRDPSSTDGEALCSGVCRLSL